MKYRVMKNQNDYFAVQVWVWYWPFWTFDYSYNEAGGRSVCVWGDLEAANARILRLQKEDEIDRWSVV